MSIGLSGEPRTLSRVHINVSMIASVTSVDASLLVRWWTMSRVSLEAQNHDTFLRARAAIALFVHSSSNKKNRVPATSVMSKVTLPAVCSATLCSMTPAPRSFAANKLSNRLPRSRKKESDENRFPPYMFSIFCWPSHFQLA